jgi:hypothetical protein
METDQQEDEVLESGDAVAPSTEVQEARSITPHAYDPQRHEQWLFYHLVNRSQDDWSCATRLRKRLHHVLSLDSLPNPLM